MTEERLVILIARNLTGELPPEELRELDGWALEAPENQELLTRLRDDQALQKELDRWSAIDPARAYAKWRHSQQRRQRVQILRVAAWLAAASLAGVFLVGSLLSKRSGMTNQRSREQLAANQPILPGRSTATLTLGNGQQILLDSVGKGQLAMEGNSRLVKVGDANLAYMNSNGPNVSTTYNVLTTPKAGQYQLTLPDGSKVWLNNVSSLRYPTSFQGKDRTVELNGEAYFEIAENTAKPFIVKVRDESVEVLGTQFNIMAYPDEGGTKTTLLRGAVRVKTGTASVKLSLDEQSQVGGDGGLKIVRDVPGADIVSWKDGFFYFGRASFAGVMRQLSRWYDVDVEYQGVVPDVEFGGKIDRSLPLSDLLKFLDKNQIHFRLEGRKLIVLPN